MRRTPEWGAHLLLDRATVPMIGRTVGERLHYVFSDGPMGIHFQRLSTGEQTLVRCAQDIYNGTGEVGLFTVIHSLDRENLAAVIEVLSSVYIDKE